MAGVPHMSFPTPGMGHEDWVCAHVGLPKTATSFLQKRYFPLLPCGYGSTERPYRWPSAFDWVYQLNELWLIDVLQNKEKLSRTQREKEFMARAATKLDDWAARADRQRGQWEGKTLLSSEGLSGFSLPTARVMANLLLGAGVRKIIFICRRQADWSISLWRQMVLKDDRFGRFVSFDYLFGNDGDISKLNLVDMDWAEYALLYQRLFGIENVLVLPYELLTKDPSAFYSKIEGFLGLSPLGREISSVRENPSVSSNIYRGWRIDGFPLIRRFPWLRIRAHRYLSPPIARFPGIAKRIFEFHDGFVMTDRRRAAIMTHFEESNRRLAQLTGLPLENYDYF